MAFGAYFSADRLNAPIRILPVTYQVEPKISVSKEMIETATILITGDRHAKKLGKFRKKMKSLIVPENIRNFKIIDISEENEGIHRTFRKLKQLKKLPKIVIYMGGTQELYEKKFRLSDRRAIYNNFGVYTNTFKISVILIFPFLSKILYQPTKFYILPPEPIQDERKYTGLQSQVRNELSFKFFQLEFQEMVKFINERGSSLIVITPPIKTDTQPHEICDNAKTEAIELFQNKMQNMIELNKYIEAIPKLKELAKNTVANSRSYHLLGKALYKAGRLKDAKDAFLKSHSFDCNPINGHIAYNAIIRGVYKQSQNFKLYDFDQRMSNLFGQDAVFYSDLYPQEIYYIQIIEEISKYSKNILNL